MAEQPGSSGSSPHKSSDLVQGHGYSSDSDNNNSDTNGGSSSGHEGLEIVAKAATKQSNGNEIQEKMATEVEEIEMTERRPAAPAAPAGQKSRGMAGLFNSVVQHIHDIEKENTEINQPTSAMTNIGHIKLKPDAATILPRKQQIMQLGDLEATKSHSEQQHRPGLLSNYLKLMHLDRRLNGSRNQSRQNLQQHPKRSDSRASQTPTVWGKQTPRIVEPPPRQEEERTWQDVEEAQRPVRNSSSLSMFSGLRRRKGRGKQSIRRPRNSNASQSKPRMPADSLGDDTLGSPGSGFFASKKSRTKGSPIGSPLASTPLANTPGMPFRHLSEALPYVASQRHLASLTGTPLAHTRRPSLSSLTGDVSTMPGVTVDSRSLKETLDGIHAMQEQMAANGDGDGNQQQPAHMTERQHIEHAIELLLLHQRFLVLCAKALMLYGAPLHHLEGNLMRLSKFLDLEMTASTLPGLILLSFDDSMTHTSETKVIKCTNGIDMHRLDETNKVLRRVAHLKIDIYQATKELEDIMTAPPIYPWYVQILNWGVLSWSLCLVFFGGSWTDSGISCMLGLIIGLMDLAAGKLSGFTNFFDASASIVAGLIGAAFAKWSCFGATALSATAVLLPGLVMTTGVIELSSRHMVAGTVRIFYALLLAFIIAYGIQIGVEIFNKLAGNDVMDNSYLDLTTCNSLSKWSWFGTFPVAIISISILVNIHWKHWFTVTTLAGATFAIFYLFKHVLFLDDLAPVVASFVLGLVANIYSKLTGQTAYVILLPGEMFLVPGSIGVRGFSSMLNNSGGQSLTLALQMITTCLSIMMGLFASTFIVYPTGKQHSAMITV